MKIWGMKYCIEEQCKATLQPASVDNGSCQLTGTVVKETSIYGQCRAINPPPHHLEMSSLLM